MFEDKSYVFCLSSGAGGESEGNITLPLTYGAISAIIKYASQVGGRVIIKPAGSERKTL